uniref:50S ribosomal protein L35 n=1 Tax=Sciadococcus taiwanensis TaxID=3028030 RepID=A0A9Y1I2A5_9RHOD|nr:50S ribosomal protein L35 [Sciadococcus taiwanensis]
MKQKLKNHKSTYKRFCITGRNKIVQRKAAKSHLLQKKTAQRKHRLSQLVKTNTRDIKSIYLMLPYIIKNLY